MLTLLSYLKMALPLQQNSMEEVIAATAYLELFIRRITEPAMMKTFLQFLLTERHDDVFILDSLVSRISSNSRVSAEDSFLWA